MKTGAFSRTSLLQREDAFWTAQYNGDACSTNCFYRPRASHDSDETGMWHITPDLYSIQLLGYRQRQLDSEDRGVCQAVCRSQCMAALGHFWPNAKDGCVHKYGFYIYTRWWIRLQHSACTHTQFVSLCALPMRFKRMGNLKGDWNF